MTIIDIYRWKVVRWVRRC